MHKSPKPFFSLKNSTFPIFGSPFLNQWTNLRIICGFSEGQMQIWNAFSLSLVWDLNLCQRFWGGPKGLGEMWRNLEENRPWVNVWLMFRHFSLKLLWVLEFSCFCLLLHTCEVVRCYFFLWASKKGSGVLFLLQTCDVVFFVDDERKAPLHITCATTLFGETKARFLG